MALEVTCDCGRILSVADDLAGGSTECSCGRTLRIPSLDEELTAPAIPGADAETSPQFDRLSPGSAAAGSAELELVLAEVSSAEPTALPLAAIQPATTPPRDFSREVSRLTNRMLLLLAIQAGLHFLMGVVGANRFGFNVTTGETPREALASGAVWMVIIYGWPLVMLAMLRTLRWPGLLRPTGLAVLAVTTARGLTVAGAHLLAMARTGVGLAESKAWLFADPVDWALIVFGFVLCRRAWRLAREAPQMLPQEQRPVSTARRATAYGLLVVTCVHGLALVAVSGWARHESSMYVLQPGFDPRREQKALLALNEGIAQADRGELEAAEKSWQRALELWEELAKPPSPSEYRVNLAHTLHNLGWLRHEEDRLDEAEPYYARAAAISEELAGDPALDDESRQIFAEDREIVEQLQNEKVGQSLAEKDQAASKQYEEAQVRADKGDAAAEDLYRQAIAAWEEVLPQAVNEDYRRQAVVRLAGAYYLLGDFQQRLGKRSQAETALGKAIDYGEQALTAEPDRPMIKHNLELALQALDASREQALYDEIANLYNAQRFAEAMALCSRSVAEQQEQLASAADHPLAEKRLAYRLERFARLLAHCPDEGVRDTQAALAHARRAAELQPEETGFWYTLALVQHRHGDWRGSLESLDQLKTRQGEFQATEWLLVAMNRCQLQEREQAQSALSKAAEWVEEQERRAKENPMLRIQLELMRPNIEALWQEAQDLMDGNDPSKPRAA